MNTTTEKTAGNLATIVNLPPETRAAQLLSFDETKAELTNLAKQSERITEITNKAGRDECHSSLMVLKGRRVDIEKRGKEARDDANKFAKAVIAKEKELIGFIAPEEERLQLLRDQYDAAIEAARLEKLEAERLRVEALQAKIDAIRNVPSTLVGKPSVIINGQLANLEAEQLSEDEFGEYFVTARDALDAAIARVRQQHADQVAHEAEQQRIAAEREELARVRAENERLQREADERAAADRAKADRRAQEERDRLAAEQRAKVEAERAERQRQEDEARAQREEQERIEREEQARRRAEQEAALQAERDRQAEAQRKLDAQAEQLRKEKAAAAKKAEAERLASLTLRTAAQAVIQWAFDNGHDDVQVVRDLEAAIDNDAAKAKPAKKAAA